MPIRVTRDLCGHHAVNSLDYIVLFVVIRAFVLRQVPVMLHENIHSPKQNTNARCYEVPTTLDERSSSTSAPLLAYTVHTEPTSSDRSDPSTCSTLQRKTLKSIGTRIL